MDEAEFGGSLGKTVWTPLDRVQVCYLWQMEQGNGETDWGFICTNMDGGPVCNGEENASH